MEMPKIRYYARLDYSNNSKKTAKYVITKSIGDYPPMAKLIGRDGKISMNLMQKLRGSTTAPAYRLQAKNSLNFTGLKDFFEDGKLTGYAYGNPLGTETYGEGCKPNPFYNYRNDGFLFIVHQDKEAQTEVEKNRPSHIELLVLEGGSQFVSRFGKSLMMGGFNDALKAFRQQDS